MKFSCEKYLLQQAISIVSRCTASKSPQPAIEGILFTAEEGVSLTGYNMKTAMHTSFAADVAKPGAIVMNTKLIGDIVRNLPDSIVYIETDDALKISIHCGSADFSMIGIDSRDYPDLPTVERKNYISFPQNIMADMIKQTIFAVSDNESRPVYTGCLFDIDGSTLNVVAVDGFRLALRREEIENGEMENCSFIVPGTTLSEIEKLCSSEEDIFITVGDKHISFGIGNTTVISRRIEGEFINYRTSIPSDFSVNIKADRQELERVVSRVSIIIDERTKYPVQLSFKDNQMTLRCRSGVGGSDDECPVSIDGECNFSIGFNNQYLLEAIRCAPTEQVSIGINSPASPCVISAADGSDKFRYMILPVRLKG